MYFRAKRQIFVAAAAAAAAAVAVLVVAALQKNRIGRGAFFNVLCYAENIYIDILNLKCAKAGREREKKTKTDTNNNSGRQNGSGISYFERKTILND